MRSIHAGRLAELLNAKTVALILLAAVAAAIFLGYRASGETSAGCVRCHADKAKLKKLNASWAYVTEEAVRRESRHSTILCRDCHLGNGRSDDKGTAHRGMLKMLIVSDSATLLDRKEGYPYGLSWTGDDRMTELMPKQREGNRWVPFPVRNILWHDRSAVTFDYDPQIISKTCGKSACHPEEMKQFATSSMGSNHRQRTMKTWLQPYGPHNCGPSFADKLPAESHDRAAFDYTNTRSIMDELNVPFTPEQARDKQKFCNVCHSGCLDCHYTPLLKDDSGAASGGVHTFRKIPTAESCSGYGRSNSMCHPGAMHSRRGETYIGGDYSVPEGMRPDVHYKKGLGCVACHATGEGGMGHIERKASCRECHMEVEDAMSDDPHRDMDCATCHISELRGYQITSWGPGLVAGKKNPFTKYSLYYGIQSPPILVKDQKGRWMPAKIMPHSLANVKPDVPASASMQFRWPQGETRDAYFVLGTFSLAKADAGSEPNNKHLLWLEIEQAAHPYGPARSCRSCHGDSEQRSVSQWEFQDNQGAEPFTGGYTIVAGRDGLRIEGMKTTSPVKLLPGYSLTDFAPWLFLKDKWSMPGDFSIKADRRKYADYLERTEQLKKTLEVLNARADSFDPKTLRQYKVLRAFALHNPGKGSQRLTAGIQPDR